LLLILILHPEHFIYQLAMPDADSKRFEQAVDPRVNADASQFTGSNKVEQSEPMDYEEDEYDDESEPEPEVVGWHARGKKTDPVVSPKSTSGPRSPINSGAKPVDGKSTKPAVGASNTSKPQPKTSK